MSRRYEQRIILSSSENPSAVPISFQRLDVDYRPPVDRPIDVRKRFAGAGVFVAGWTGQTFRVDSSS